MYRWNSAITAAFWEPIGHLEVALRNTLDNRLAARHRRLGRSGSWLDDPAQELSSRARLDIVGARDRVRQKGKRASDGQTISELSFGFWRFLITKKLTGLWPDLAGGFRTLRTASRHRRGPAHAITCLSQPARAPSARLEPRSRRALRRPAHPRGLHRPGSPRLDRGYEQCPERTRGEAVNARSRVHALIVAPVVRIGEVNRAFGRQGTVGRNKVGLLIQYVGVSRRRID